MAEQVPLQFPVMPSRTAPVRPPKKPSETGAMTYRQAKARLDKVGAANAHGDVLRAMYAFLLAGRTRRADPARMYAYPSITKT